MNIHIAFGAPVFLLQNGAGGGGIIGVMMPMIIVFAIFYLLVIRPQQKRQRQTQKDRELMLSSLKSGDRVITTGGIYGTVVAARENTVTLRIAEKVSVEVLRSAISGPQASEAKEVEPAK
jgi:preprotein translocase subunit YajC